MINKIYLIVLFTFFIGFAKGQNDVTQLINDSLKVYGKNILNAKTQEDRSKANQQFFNILYFILQDEKSFEASFDSAKNMLVLSPENKTFRIYTWAGINPDGIYEYFGFIQTMKKGKVFLFKLNDRSNEIKNADMATLDATKWYGAIYYKILENKSKNGTYYTLLAWDGNDKITNKKIIDVLTFDKKGFPKFGAPIFYYEKEKKIKKRVILEYNDNAQVSLKWEAERKQIVFNHLSPSESKYAGNFQFYFPDEGNDAFEFKKGKWNFLQEVDIRLENLK